MLAAIRRMLSARTQLPVELQAVVDAEDALFVARRVTVIQRFSGSVPGLHSGASVSRTSGTLLLTSQRAVATLASRAGPHQGVVDCRWDATAPGPLKVVISTSGVQVDLDIGRVDPGFRGHLGLHYKVALPADVLARLPKTTLAQNITAADVCLALGVRPTKR